MRIIARLGKVCAASRSFGDKQSLAHL